jgi:hypothetical protein
MGAGGGLGVVLDAEGWDVFAAEALNGVVVEVEMGQLDVGVGEARGPPGRGLGAK